MFKNDVFSELLNRYHENKMSHAFLLETNDIEQCYKDAKKILEKNETLVLLLADALMKYETITKEQIEHIVETGSIDSLEEVENAEDRSVREARLEDLKREAKDRGIKGYSKMNLDELEDAIAKNVTGEDEGEKEDK